MKYSTTRKCSSFIHSGYLYSAPSRHLLRGALSPATAKEKCLYHGCCLYIRCFAIDESGFIIIHKDFGTGLPTGSLHIAAREPAVSSDLILGGSLIADTCINYVSLPITKRLFWKASYRLRNLNLCNHGRIN